MPKNIPLDVVFEDEDLLVINKLPGMTVQFANEAVEQAVEKALEPAVERADSQLQCGTDRALESTHESVGLAREPTRRRWSAVSGIGPDGRDHAARSD